MRLAANFGIATGAYIGERDDWDAAVGRAAAEGWAFVELTAIVEERLESLFAFFAGSPDSGARFERISIHAPVVFHTSAASVVERRWQGRFRPPQRDQRRGLQEPGRGREGGVPGGGGAEGPAGTRRQRRRSSVTSAGRTALAVRPPPQMWSRQRASDDIGATVPVRLEEEREGELLQNLTR